MTTEHEHEHGENCGCGEEDHVIILADEEGNEREMVVVYTFESEDKAYAVLIDRNEPESDGVIFRLEEEDEESFLVPIEDDAEWDKVVAVYEGILEEENS